MELTKYNSRTYYLFDSFEEFETYFKKLIITRTINKLQVHHTSAPSYENWSSDIELRRIRNTIDYHKKTFGANDIAQHFTIFPNGKIATGRDINLTPIGIKNWNTNAICCEIYGNFDTDNMTAEQKESIIKFYGTLCKVLKIKPSTETIRYHSWFTSSGTYLGTYKKGESCKTCPGLKFFGGNSKEAMEKNLLPLITNYVNTGKTTISTTVSNTTTVELKYSRVLNYSTPIKEGEDVKAIQEKLKSLKFYNDKVDGFFGKGTETAVKSFQKANSLTVDGSVGPKTFEKLFEKITKIYYRVITGTYINRASAEKESEALKKKGYTPFLLPHKVDNKDCLRVVAISSPTKAEAEKVQQDLLAKGYKPTIIKTEI